MAEITTVARPYAKAAFQFAQECAQLAAWSQMLGLLAGVVRDADFHALLDMPGLSGDELAEALLKVCGEQVSPEVANFVRQLARNKRLDALPAISELFDTLRAEAEGALDVEVTAAYALDDKQAQALANTLKEKLSRQVNLSCQVDASLIGGVLIRAGDLVIDASIRGKLGKLGATLNS